MDRRNIPSVEAMEALAAEVAGNAFGGQTLLLSGELGSGKTTFVQGLARALDIHGPVTSPTFVISSEYVIPSHPSLHTLVHADLYRLRKRNAAADPAVRDVIERASEPGRLTVIEWADRLGQDVPPQAQRISFEAGKTPTERVLTFS